MTFHFSNGNVRSKKFNQKKKSEKVQLFSKFWIEPPVFHSKLNFFELFFLKMIEALCKSRVSSYYRIAFRWFYYNLQINLESQQYLLNKTQRYFSQFFLTKHSFYIRIKDFNLKLTMKEEEGKVPRWWGDLPLIIQLVT